MSKKVLSATALALLLGVGTFSLHTALAQNGGEARGNARETKKALDDKHLTPIRPIRRVGDDSWPAAKNQPAPVRETTGQSAQKEEPAKQEPAQSDSKPEAKPEAKPDAKRESTAQRSDQDKKGDKGFASIRLGTDTKAASPLSRETTGETATTPPRIAAPWRAPDWAHRRRDAPPSA